MKHTRKLLALLLSVATLLSLAISASAYTTEDAVIDYDQTGSMAIYKYDMTSAKADGVSTDAYLATGHTNADAAAALSPYAMEGVEFTYLYLGEIMTSNVGTEAGREIQVTYGVSNQTFLDALGLKTSDAVSVIGTVPYFTSHVLTDALADQLLSNNTSTKNALEALIATDDNAVSMELTDSTGMTSASDLDLGLYLVVETSVPENVTSVVDPFLVSVPMTDMETLDGWFYDVTVYPKNQTGNPTLEKEVSDAQHGLSFSDAENGYEDVATASDGDVLNYRILSTLPAIHSTATYLSQYTFVDTLSKGLEYNQNDVKICWYADYADALADYITASQDAAAVNGANADVTWNYGSDYFSVQYDTADKDATTMTVALTESGLAQVNTPASQSDQEGRYSGWTMVIYYNATLHTDEMVTYGDNGNPNDVTLTWERTTEGFYDTLEDEAKVYTYGIDLTKEFSGEGDTDYTSVQFILKNTSDPLTGYAVATSDQAGVYYITGYTENVDDATRFSPDDQGKLRIYGLEEDTYELTEVKTADGYTLLKEPIVVDITTEYTQATPVGSLTASATVDGEDAGMTASGDSAHAMVPLTVLNTRGFDLPQTGGSGTLMFTVCGILLAGCVVALAVLFAKAKSGKENHE